MKKELVYKIFSLTLSVMLVFCMSTCVFARPMIPTATMFEPGGGVPAGGTPTGGSPAGGAGTGLMNTIFGTETTPSVSDTEIVGMMSDVLAIVQFCGYSIAVGMVIYAGIKYMMSSANDKAELKNSSIRLVIGAIIVGGSAALFPMFWTIFQTVSQ